jgi:hypothetical protein
VPDDCEHVAIDRSGMPRGFSYAADPKFDELKWFITKGFWRAGTVLNWKTTLAKISERPKR